MTGQTLALALLVVLLVGWIMGFSFCMGIDWYYARKARRDLEAWEAMGLSPSEWRQL